MINKKMVEELVKTLISARKTRRKSFSFKYSGKEMNGMKYRVGRFTTNKTSLSLSSSLQTAPKYQMYKGFALISAAELMQGLPKKTSVLTSVEI